MTKISVVIITLNEEEYLPDLLQSIEDQNFQDYEVIVSDAKSSDNTREIARDYGAKVVEGERKGPGYGRNLGAEEAEGEIILFLDGDTELIGSEILNNVKESIEKSKNVVGVSTSKSKGESIRGKIFYELGSLYVGIFNRLGYYIMTPGNFIFIERDIFREIGGFDEKMPFCEDNDMVDRAMEHGDLVTLSNQYYISSRRVDEKGLIGAMKDYYPPQIYRMLGMEDRMKEKYSFETAGSSE